MLITLLCPEYVTWIAFQQWQSARRWVELVQPGAQDWSMQHAFYVDMGGLQLSIPGNAKFQASANGFIKELEKGVVYDIRHDDLIVSMKNGVLPRPSIPASELQERSKNDRFAQLVTLFQIVYFTTITFGRLAAGLPVSTLEISTLAFISCAAFIEYFWWHKPLDLRNATTIKLSEDKLPAFIKLFPELRFKIPEQDLAEMIDVKLFFDRMFTEHDMKKDAKHAVWIGCIFNGIHISAWYFDFPTDTERLLWQIASVGACGAVAGLWAAAFVKPKLLGLLVGSGSAVFYCLCRLYLMIAVFSSLRLSPKGLYDSPKWQSALPGV